MIGRSYVKYQDLKLKIVKFTFDSKTIIVNTYIL